MMSFIKAETLLWLRHFHHLNILGSITCLPAWEEWDSFERDAFALLQMLRLEECSRLVGDLPKTIPTLELIHISNCQQLAASIPMAWMLRIL